MIATWNAGTPLAGKQYEVDGTLAQRTGSDLEDALAVELGIGREFLSVSGTSVMVVPVPGEPAVALLTLSDGEIDRPANDWFGQHVNDLAKNASGDLRTLMKMVLRRIIRYIKRRGVGKTAFLNAVGALWDATTTNGD